MPRLQRKSNAHLVICRLVDLGGTAKLSTLVEVLSPENRRPYKIQNTVLDILVGLGFIVCERDVVKATAAGKEYVGGELFRHLPVASTYVGQVALPRTAPNNKPLNLSKIYPAAIYREGAFEHRSIPSMMGGKRILPNGEVVE
jgi:hypothetical protein